MSRDEIECLYMREATEPWAPTIFTTAIRGFRETRGFKSVVKRRRDGADEVYYVHIP